MRKTVLWEIRCKFVYDVNSSILNHDVRRMINAMHDAMTRYRRRCQRWRIFLLLIERLKETQERNLLLVRRKSERNWNLQWFLASISIDNCVFWLILNYKICFLLLHWITLIFSFSLLPNIKHLHGKTYFTEIFKNLGRYRSKNNFIRVSK